MTLLFESNIEIDKLVDYLHSKIVIFRQKHPKSQLLPYLKTFNTTVVLQWMEEYKLQNIEPNTMEDTAFKNEILDVINLINELENLKPKK